MLEIEEEIYREGYKYIAAIDEVGRGCLAGDVLACAVVMPRGLMIPEVNDSKKLSEKKRNKLYEEIKKNALGIGIGRVGPELIDEINIKESTRLAMKAAIENIRDRDGNPLKADYALIDAEELDLDIPSKSIIKGDKKSHGIACASIIAKVDRDNLCKEWDISHPGYNLSQHKGYGTKKHRESILEKGPSEIHRRSFLKKILAEKG